MLYLVICGEVRQMKPLTTARTLHLPYSSTPSQILRCLLFFHFKGSGAYEIRSGLDFPRANLCPAEENIKNTQRCMSAHKQQYFLFVQIGSSNPLPLPVEAPASGVVVESGPVVYDDVPGDEEEDEEDETCVSALEMLGSNGGFNLSAIF